MFITQKHLSRRTVLKGMGADDGAAVPRGDGARPQRVRRDVEQEDAAGLRGDGARRRRQLADRDQEEPVGAGGRRPGFRFERNEPQVARAVQGLPDDCEQLPTCGTPKRSRRRKSAATTSGRAPCSSRRCIRSRRRGRTSTWGPRWIRSTRRSTARTRRFRRCSCASRTWIRQAAARTAIPAPTPIRSAGRRRRSRCRWCAIRAWSSISCSASARHPASAGSGAPRTAACSTP